MRELHSSRLSQCNIHSLRRFSHLTQKSYQDRRRPPPSAPTSRGTPAGSAGKAGEAVRGRTDGRVEKKPCWEKGKVTLGNMSFSSFLVAKSPSIPLEPKQNHTSGKKRSMGRKIEGESYASCDDIHIKRLRQSHNWGHLGRYRLDGRLFRGHSVKTNCSNLYSPLSNRARTSNGTI